MEQYKDKLEKIEGELSKIMPSHSPQSWMSQMTSSCPTSVPPFMIDKFNAPGVELLSRGGKRWRPLVMVLCYEAMGGKDDLIYSLAPLVELPHNGSLIVDDIEDKSEERRGAPSVHLIYGDDISINAGNLMYFNGTGLVKDLPISFEMKFKILDQYCENLRRLHLGQGLDIQWHNDHELLPDIEVYLQMCRFKTGALARFAAQAGVLLACNDDQLAKSLGGVWEQAGVGFQILDDIKNLTTGNPGKKRGDDIVEGKKSLPLLLFLKKNPDQKAKMATLFATANAKGIEQGNVAVEEAISLMEKAGVLKEAGNIASDMMADSIAQLKTLLPQGEALSLQIDMINEFMNKML